MTSNRSQPLTIDPSLQTRLTVLAEREGFSLAEFAERVLRGHADQAEHEIVERGEDEHRWQRYLDSGIAIPFETMRGKLRRLAAEAAQRAEPQ